MIDRNNIGRMTDQEKIEALRERVRLQNEYIKKMIGECKGLLKQYHEQTMITLNEYEQRQQLLEL